MNEGLLSLVDLDRLLSRLREKGVVYAPSRATSEASLIEWPKNSHVSLAFTNFPEPPKAFFFPPRQALLLFAEGRWETPGIPEGPVFLFGVRPCDARALLAMDRVLLDGESTDPFYAARRQNTTVIALACARPASTCFCTSVGGGPGDSAGADLLAVELSTGMLFRACSGKGEELLGFLADLLTAPGAAEIKECEEGIRVSEAQIIPVRTDGIARRLSQAYEAPLWETAGQKCLGCGACSFLCPTCHCFDITDEIRGGKGRRVRTWDSCAFASFTQHASGHNPRPTARERWRQRIMHKFRYAVETHGMPFCVGCGRCIRSCPVGVDLRTALRDVEARP